MNSTRIKFTAYVVALALSCPAFAQPQVVEPAGSDASATTVVPVVERKFSVEVPSVLALAPIFPPQYYSVESYSAGFAGMAFGVMGALAARSVAKERSTKLKEAIESKMSLSKELMDALRDECTRVGRGLVDVEDPKYYPGEPENLDYKSTVSQSNWILTANIFDVGMKAPITIGKFVPRLNVTFYLTNKHTEEVAFQQSIYFGVDAGKKENDYYIPVDEKSHYENFDDVLNKRDEFVEVLRFGLKALAKSAVEQIGRVKLESTK